MEDAIQIQQIFVVLELTFDFFLAERD